jgi:CheY-specific phosphatase CheX
LNPLTKPFEYITLNGKLTLYARRDATDQLRQLHKVSIEIVAREVVEDCYVVTARATTPIRQDESIGAVNIAGLKGDVRANAMMKAETKAKRRVTLSICGLGMLDETEVDSIPGARITPSAGIEEQLNAEEVTKVNEVAARMHAWLANGAVGDAVYELENAGFNAEQTIYAWTHFDSKQRSAMKKEQARIKAAAQAGIVTARPDPYGRTMAGGMVGYAAEAAPNQPATAAPDTISDAARKRLEARISELKLDREMVKQYITMTFGRAHFSELTKNEYRVVDGFVELAGSDTLEELARTWNLLGKDDKKMLTAIKDRKKAYLEAAQSPV